MEHPPKEGWIGGLISWCSGRFDLVDGWGWSGRGGGAFVGVLKGGRCARFSFVGVCWGTFCLLT